MNHIIYRITNQINGKIYVGAHSTSDIADGYMGSSIPLNHAYKKYSKQNFIKDILFVLADKDAMYAKEKEIVNEEFISRNDTYNLNTGGNGGWGHWNDGSNKHRAQCKKAAANVVNRFDLVASGKGNATKFSNSNENRLKASIASMEPDAILKRKNTFQNINHQQGSKNSQFGSHWYTADGIVRKKFKSGQQPNGWITSIEYKRNHMIQGTSFNKHWYNDGVKSYLKFEKDAVGLIKGRLN